MTKKHTYIALERGTHLTASDGHLPDSDPEYFLIPVTNAREWDATSIMNAELIEPVGREYESHLKRLETLRAEARHGKKLKAFQAELGWDPRDDMIDFAKQNQLPPMAKYTTIAAAKIKPHPEVLVALKASKAELAMYRRLPGVDIRIAKGYDDLATQYLDRLALEPPTSPVKNALANLLSRVPDGPLRGVLVVAFDQQIAGSLAAEELARAGATVIKVEREGEGDPKRHNSTQSAFNTFNAGKFSVAFGNNAADKQLKKDLLAHADVIIDNRSEKAQLRDAVLQDELRRTERDKPVIYSAISGFGRGQQIPAYDRVVQAATGMAEMNGKLVAFPLIDMATGKEAAHQITNYLFMRERMTPGQCSERPCMRLDVSMAAVALSMMANPIATYMDTGKQETSIVPFDLYETNDGKIAIAVAKDDQFARLCDVIDAPDLKQYVTNKQRQAHREVIERRMHEQISRKGCDEWMEIFRANNISASPVVSLSDAIAHHGHDVVKATADGGLVVGAPTTSSVFPRNPHIGSAPAHNADKEAVSELVAHFSLEPRGQNTLNRAQESVSDSPEQSFQRSYKFVDIRSLDFNKAESDLPWAMGKVFSFRKIGKIHAEEAKPFEIIHIRYGNKFTEQKVAMKGDWKITTTHGDQYTLSGDKFHRLYVPAGKPGEYKPNPKNPPRKAVVATEDIKFTVAWGDTAYIPKGGWIALGSDGPYGIHPDNMKHGEYKCMDWQGKALAGVVPDMGWTQTRM